MYKIPKMKLETFVSYYFGYALAEELTELMEELNVSDLRTGNVLRNCAILSNKLMDLGINKFLNPITLWFEHVCEDIPMDNKSYTLSWY